jgi:accessory gene regulator B
MLIILSVFITFRPLTGGYHAKSFTGCFIGTISIFGAIIFIGEKIMPMLETPVMLGTIWLVLANMFLVGPIKNPVHILENGTYMKLHKKIRKLCMGEVVLCSVWIIFQRSLYSDIHVCAILVVFILMLCGLKIEGK